LDGIDISDLLFIEGNLEKECFLKMPGKLINEGRLDKITDHF